jgi:GH18 family chitinase
MFDMKLIPIFLTLVFLTSCGGSTPPPTPPEPALVSTASPTPIATRAPFAVIGYFPDYRELNPAWAQSLTDILYFSAEPRADGTLDTSRLSEETWKLLQQLKTEHAIRIHLSIGGWERGNDFAELTANQSTRRAFVENLLTYLLTHNLDGADFDWEFPQNDTEFANYISLLIETQAALSARGISVSVALPADPSFPLADFAVVDRVHIMSYDRAAKHATYQQAVDDVQLFLDAGIPAEKLILGVPFYGRNMQPPYRVLSYAEIMKQYQPASGMDEVDGVYFNGLETIQEKVRFAMGEELGGVMIWELAHDTTDTNSLLQRMYALAIGKIPC